jgi:hypothetical protein
VELGKPNGSQEFSSRQCLSPASLAQRNVLLTLQSPDRVPLGFPVSGNDQAMGASRANEARQTFLVRHGS